MRIPRINTASSQFEAGLSISSRPAPAVRSASEFIGDTIETLRVYDPATQRSTGPIDQVAIVPLRDILDGRRDASIFDYLALAASARASSWTSGTKSTPAP